MKPSRFVTVEEAAELLPAGKPGKAHMTRAQLYNLIEAGEIKLKRKWVLSRRDVERLATKRAKRKEQEQAVRERRRLMEEKLEAVRREFATGGGRFHGEP